MIGDNATGSTNGYQNNKPFENTYYSRIRFRNGDDQLCISYRSGLMILEVGNVDSNFKFDQKAVIYLSPMKAGLLVNEINELIKYANEGKKIDPNKGFGVTAGMNEKVSFIAFSTDSDKKFYATIGKFDQQGVITESTKYEFAQDYNYSLEWNNVESNDIVKIFNNAIEIEMLKNALADFSRNMSGALAYTVADTARYDEFRKDRKINQVFDKLGIERISYSQRKPAVENNFLTNASSKSTSIEDIEDLIS